MNSKESTPCASGSSVPKENKYYALQTCSEQEDCPYIVIGMLKVFNLDAYD